MLIVVEGPSAVGKTTLLGRMPAAQVVGEVPLRMSADASREEFLSCAIESNALRWKRLLDTEDLHGRAYADSDPLKLYYDFARVSVGDLTREAYEIGWRWMQHAMAERQVGFADRVVFLSASPEVLARRRAGDTTRRRRKFALHTRLIPAMRSYYEALDRIRPDTVRWLDAEGDLPETIPLALREQPPHRRERYDISDLELLKRELDQTLPRDT